VCALTERHAVPYRNTKYLCKELGLDILIGLCKNGFSRRVSALMKGWCEYEGLHEVW
jgi:hypothetical protein